LEYTNKQKLFFAPHSIHTTPRTWESSRALSWWRHHGRWCHYACADYWG